MAEEDFPGENKEDTTMAEQPQVPENVTPAQFFEELLPTGFAAQTADGSAPGDFTIQFAVQGEGGGEWVARVADGKMAVSKGREEANLTVSVGVEDWRDAVLQRNGAALSLILPPQRPGRPDNSARAKQIKGTMGLELSRPEKDPFRVEMCFNNAPAPKTTIKMTIGDYVDMAEGKLNGQMAFMSGKLKVEGDMGFLMQIAALTA
jgi:SCP-2 sterol transfer family